MRGPEQSPGPARSSRCVTDSLEAVRQPIEPQLESALAEVPFQMLLHVLDKLGVIVGGKLLEECGPPCLQAPPSGRRGTWYGGVVREDKISRPDYLVFEPISDIDVRLYGRAAVLTYQSEIDIVVSGLGHFTHEAWHTYLYEKQHGRWQVVWEQATAIGGFPPA